MAKSLRVDVYSHHFAVTRFDRDCRNAMVKFMMDFAEYDITRKWSGEVERQLKRFYIASTENKREVRFHRNVWSEFVSHMGRYGYSKDSMDIHHHDVPTPSYCDIRMMPSFTPYDYQTPMIVRGAKLDEPLQALVMAGGLGKTAVALAIASALKMRTGIVIRGMYVDRWSEAVLSDTRVLDVTMDDCLIVRGAKDLKGLIELGKTGQLSEKVVIITNMTLHAFFKHYELFPEDTSVYGCKPVDLYEITGIGYRIIDEVHQDFHLNFRQDLYTNIAKTLSLSASLKKSSSFINRMYDVIFPRRVRIDGKRKDPYCAVTALFYQMGDYAHSRMRWLNSRNQYAQIEFEQSILKDKKLLANYLNIIEVSWDEYFTNKYLKGMKGLVFAGRVEMCDAIVTHFRKCYPDLKISRYTSDDEYENLTDSDIVVSTLLSAGTAVDVPDLRTAFMTTAIGSIDGNMQAFWRIRELKRWPNETPDFIYLVCGDIAQHNEYHRIKLEEYVGYAKSHKTVHVGLKL